MGSIFLHRNLHRRTAPRHVVSSQICTFDGVELSPEIASSSGIACWTTTCTLRLFPSVISCVNTHLLSPLVPLIFLRCLSSRWPSSSTTYSRVALSGIVDAPTKVALPGTVTLCKARSSRLDFGPPNLSESTTCLYTLMLGFCCSVGRHDRPTYLSLFCIGVNVIEGVQQLASRLWVRRRKRRTKDQGFT